MGDGSGKATLQILTPHDQVKYNVCSLEKGKVRPSTSSCLPATTPFTSHLSLSPSLPGHIFLKCESTSFDLFLDVGMRELSLTVSGKVPVHVTGYYEPDFDEFDEDEDEDEDDLMGNISAVRALAHLVGGWVVWRLSLTLSLSLSVCVCVCVCVSAAACPGRRGRG